MACDSNKPASVTQVFATFELLEMILLNTLSGPVARDGSARAQAREIRALHCWQRVNSAVYDVIVRSKPLAVAMFRSCEYNEAIHEDRRGNMYRLRKADEIKLVVNPLVKNLHDCVQSPRIFHAAFTSVDRDLNGDGTSEGGLRGTIFASSAAWKEPCSMGWRSLLIANKPIRVAVRIRITLDGGPEGPQWYYTELEEGATLAILKDWVMKMIEEAAVREHHRCANLKPIW